MSVQVQSNKLPINMLSRVSAALKDARHYDQMNHAATQLICNSLKPISSMNKDEIEILEDEVLDYFESREWLGEHPNRFRFESGSLFEYDKTSRAYIHCLKQAGCTTEKDAVSEYLKQLSEPEA